MELIVVLAFLGICTGLTSAQEYVGCFKSPTGESDAVLAVNHATPPQNCTAECKDRYYIYAALMNGQLCYCMSRYRTGPSSGCTIPCITEPNLFCGSHDSMSVYKTGQKAPSPPRQLQVTKTGSRSLSISWQPPNIQNGNVTSYMVRSKVVETYAGRSLLPTQAQIQGGSSGSTTLTNLQPGSKYNISVTALNSDAESDPISILEWTSIDVPVRPAKPKILRQSGDKMILELYETFSPNGPLTAYQVLVIYPGTVPPIDSSTAFSNYETAMNKSIPYYITGEFDAADFSKYQEFVVGDGNKINGFYNAPLAEPFENPQFAVVAVSRTRNEAKYSYSDISGPSGLLFDNFRVIILGCGVAFGSILLIILVIAYVLMKRRHAQQIRFEAIINQRHEMRTRGPIQEVDNRAYIPEDVPEVTNHYQALKEKVWYMPEDALTLETDQFRNARYGAIHRGTVRNKNGIIVDAFIHCIPDYSQRASEKKNMLRELDICIKAGSMKYLASFIGNYEGPDTTFIAFEGPSDNLKAKLLASRSAKSFPYDQILPIASMIAEGLNYLEVQRIFHSHLCARSIGLNNDYIPKIMGYGISKYVLPDIKLARWTSPERFGSAKNQPAVVWAFAVLVWEMMAMGGTPYHDLEDETDVEEAVVENHVRLPQLKDMPDPLYEVLMSCWNDDTHERPSFEELTRLNTLSLCPITEITEPYIEKLELHTDSFYSYHRRH